MTWAARRKTTRVEDVAYSLIGIFNVSLQITYREGGESVFRRLIEAIVRTGNPSVLDWNGEVAHHLTPQVIPLSPQSFVDHRDLDFEDVRLEVTTTSPGLRVSAAAVRS
ncbi:hypothetical protein AZE42_05197 [Rhizopogon vesiculosus]|uniref:Uncharacterized protein n=1 Tax=Rhizopogon vesiculosus TaxID=180088 RepID=A0A1J8Q7L6_9AGAM|nr:hypothetical protein AZE42_05197 [Rhizopogon vesiculosus]